MRSMLRLECLGGRVFRIVMDTDRGLAVGVLVRQGILRADGAVGMNDVEECRRKQLVLRKGATLQEVHENMRIREALEKGGDGLLGRRVVTQLGVLLGKVEDAVLDAETWVMVQLVVRSGGMVRTREYRIGRQQVVTITREEVVVRDTQMRDVSRILAESPAS